MDQSRIIKELERNRKVFRSLLKKTEEDAYRWKPALEKWCLLEVLCHLYDEEREDFRARVKHCLENPELPLKPINPVGWVKERTTLGKISIKSFPTFSKKEKHR